MSTFNFPDMVCPLKNTCWESAQEADFFPGDLKSISGAEELEKMYLGRISKEKTGGRWTVLFWWIEGSCSQV